MSRSVTIGVPTVGVHCVIQSALRDHPCHLFDNSERVWSFIQQFHVSPTCSMKKDIVSSRNITWCWYTSTCPTALLDECLIADIAPAVHVKFELSMRHLRWLKIVDGLLSCKWSSEQCSEAVGLHVLQGKPSCRPLHTQCWPVSADKFRAQAKQKKWNWIIPARLLSLWHVRLSAEWAVNCTWTAMQSLHANIAIYIDASCLLNWVMTACWWCRRLFRRRYDSQHWASAELLSDCRSDSWYVIVLIAKR